MMWYDMMTLYNSYSFQKSKKALSLKKVSKLLKLTKMSLHAVLISKQLRMMPSIETMNLR